MVSTAQQLPIRVFIEGGKVVRTELSGIGRDGERELAKLEKQGKRTSTEFETLTRRTNLVKAGAQALTVATAALGGATALGLVIKNTLAWAESMTDAAAVAGINVERLQSLRFAFAQFGVEQRLVDEGFRRFTRRLGLAVQGTGEAKSAYEELGISVTDAAGRARSSEDVFDDVVRKLAGLGSQAEIAATASRLFGEDAGPKLAVLLAQGADSIEDLEERARDLGIVLEKEMLERAARLNREWENFAQTLEVRVKGAILDVVGALQSLQETGLPPEARSLGFLRSEERRIEDQLAALQERRRARAADLEGLEGNSVEARRLAASVARIDQVINSLENQLVDIGAELTRRGVGDGTEIGVRPLRVPPGLLEPPRRPEEILVRRRQETEFLAAAGSEITEAQFAASFGRLTELVRENEKAQQEAYEKSLNSATDWESGVLRGLRRVRDDLKDTADAVETGLVGGFQAAEDAFVEWRRTGELSLESVGRAFEEMLLRIAFRRAVLGPFEALFEGLATQLGEAVGAGIFTPAPAPVPQEQLGRVGVGHGGGVIGVDAFPTRLVNMSFFRDAQRFHNGGEVPIIAQRGETILTPGQMRAMSAGRSPVINIIDNRTPDQPSPQVSRSQGPDGQDQIDIVLEQSFSRLATSGRLDRINSENFGTARPGVRR